MLIPEAEQTHWFAQRSLDIASGKRNEWPARLPWNSGNSGAIHPYVQQMIVKTNGMLYEHLRGNLDSYPIPEIRLPKGTGSLLDIGCSWGRWTVAAARKGYAVIGIDPDIYAIMAARDVCKHFGITAEFVVGDSRFLPFPDMSFHLCFSYSVLQHMSPSDAATTVSEIGRVLRKGSRSLVQMANRNGVRSLYHIARRRFMPAKHFEVRYLSPAAIREMFQTRIGPSKLSVDGFFGLGIQQSDLALMTRRNGLVIRASEALRSLSQTFHPIVYAADSIYVESTKNDS